jgi:hypothetical protein
MSHKIAAVALIIFTALGAGATAAQASVAQPHHVSQQQDGPGTHFHG